MKLTAIILLTACLQVGARGYSQTVTLTLNKVPVQQVFKEIFRQTGISVIYNEAFFKNFSPVTLNVKNSPIRDVLDRCLRDQPLSYSFDGNTILIVSRPFPIPQTQPEALPPSSIEIHGRVTDADGIPLSGISVFVKGSKTGTITDADGRFVLTASIGDRLIFSSVEYESKEFRLNSGSSLSLTLSKKVTALQDVVINKGYYSTSQQLNTGSVTKITAETIEKQPVSNPLAALEGQVPGMTVIQSSGDPGGSFRIRIRGYNSLAQGNEPLYIIDGVPFSNLPFADLGYSGASNWQQSPFASINPADIASIEVLKDADATAIYGSRGANGVILITTKKGRLGKTKVELNTYQGWGHVTRMVDMMNLKQYLSMRREAFRNDGAAMTNANAYDLLLWDTTRSTDWQRLLLGGSAHYSETNLGLSGGNEQTQFLIGMNYHYETTVYPGSFSDHRGGSHINVNHSSVDKKLNITATVSYNSDQNGLPAAVLSSYINLAPDAPRPYDASGNLNWSENGQSFSNPLSYTKQKSKTTTDNLIGSASLQYKILPNLVLKGNAGYNFIQTNQLQTLQASSYNPANNPTGSAYFGNTSFRNWIAEPQLEYKFHLAKHKLEILAGTTFQQSQTTKNSIIAFGITDDALIQSASAATSQETNSGFVDYRYNAFFGRMGYNYEDKYLVNLTGRRDGSSRFGPGNQFANFGAIGAAWIFSKETFIQEGLPFLSFGKLRGSYGVTGNDQISDYQYLDNYTTTLAYQGQTGYYPYRIANSNYGWEVNRKAEGAIELGLLQDRILLTTNYFRNVSGNQLVYYLLPDQVGRSGILKNFPAKIENYGWEFDLSTVNIKTKDFSWKSSFNLTATQNKLLEFPGLATSSYASYYAIGHSINIVKKYNYTGVDPTTGTYTFKDVNQDGVLNNTDKTSIKDLTPRYYGGISNDLKYKNFGFSFFWQFVKQNGINFFAQNSYNGVYAAGGINLNEPVDVLDRWQKPGDKTTFQKYTATTAAVRTAASNWANNSDGAVTDASFLRLKNASFSYTLPFQTQNKKTGQIRMYIQGENLLTITRFKGADPETSSRNRVSATSNIEGIQSNGVAPLKVFVGGIQFTF